MNLTYLGKNLLVDDTLVEFITDKLKEEQVSISIHTLLDAGFDMHETCRIIESVLGKDAFLCGKPILFWFYAEDDDKQNKMERALFTCLKRRQNEREKALSDSNIV